jgi:uncharacterized phage-like protein YoqJ
MDISKTCAIFACPPICFPWGYDEEDEGCAAMKLQLLNAITTLRTEGIERFNVVLDPGFGLYAAEMIIGLQEMDPSIEMDLYIPFEEQASKWSPELRERYFTLQEHASVVATIGRREDADHEFRTYLSAFELAGAVIAVIERDAPRGVHALNASTAASYMKKDVIRLER